MKEILKLSHICTEKPRNFKLQDFNLNICEGDIIYLFANTDVEKNVIINILTGVRNDYTGNIHLYGELKSWNSELAHAGRVFYVDERRQLVYRFNIMENICAMVKGACGDIVIPKNAHYSETQKLLDFLQLSRNPRDQIEDFSHYEKQLVCIAKMLYRGARILLLNGAENTYNMREILHLRQLIRKLADKGIAIVLFQKQPEEILSVCTKCILMRGGSDSKVLFQPEITKERIAEYRIIHSQTEPAFFAEGEMNRTAYRVLGYYDLGIDSNVGFAEYIQRLCQEDLQTQSEVLDLLKTAREPDNVAVIASDSADTMLDNLDLAANLDVYFWSLSARKRVLLQKHYSQYLRKAFLQKFGLDEEIRRIAELSYYERKLLSIYRWMQIGKYSSIILEEPYLNLQGAEVEGMRKYLAELSLEHGSVQIFSKNAAEMVRICDGIILSYNGKFIKYYSKCDFEDMITEAPKIIEGLI